MSLFDFLFIPSNFKLVIKLNNNFYLLVTLSSYLDATNCGNKVAKNQTWFWYVLKERQSCLRILS